MNPKIQKTMPIVLSMASVAGLIATSYLVAKSTEKYHDKLEASKDNKKKYAKTILKCYSPAIISGLATAASITAGTIIQKKTEMSLSATCVVLDKTLRKYKYKVKEVVGDKFDDFTKSLADDEIEEIKQNKEFIDKDGYRLYHEDHIGFFKAKPDDFNYAVTKLNERILTNECYCSLRMFLEDMNAILCDKNVDDISYDYGWSSESLKELNWGFVHVKTEPFADNSLGEVEYIEVSFDKEPIFGISEYAKYNGYSLKDLDAKELLFNEEQYITKKGK